MTITIKRPQKYSSPYNKYLANNGWLGVAHHLHMQTIYQSGYLPDHSISWRSHKWTRQNAYRRSHEDFGLAVNPKSID